METCEFDKIIKKKILESNELHEHDIASAKPFIWSAIQNRVKGKRLLKWHHLAAAILLLVIGFSFILHRVQKGHQYEIELLSNKIDQLQKNYLSQVDLLQSKDTEIESLGNQVNITDLQLTNLQQQNPLPQKESIIYRTDTVFLKQIEYITSVSEPIDAEEFAVVSEKKQLLNMEKGKNQEIEIDHIIFPSYSSQDKGQKSETIKFKFVSLTASKK